MKSKPLQEFPIVGVGASAGGIDSFKQFLSAIPENSGMAYILVQHLSPSHQSVLPEILARATNLPVSEITQDCKLLPDHIYVIPENKLLEVTDHSLRLTPREEGKQHMPIDVFFSSMARVHGKLAAGVVLSGTAHDGTVGLRDIKEFGGIALAEDPGSAKWDGMPKSAIEAGVVDFVLRPKEMPAQLIKVFSNYVTEDTLEANEEWEMEEDVLNKIISVIRQKSGVDFSHYKKPTVLRRIDRRMAINQMARQNDYLELLRENKTEQELLFQDLLIKVTSFFRDGEVYEELKKSIFPKLLQQQSEADPLRIWIAGCATGEEVYSLAICLFDVMDVMDGMLNDSQNSSRIQIFATDISERAIMKARSGVYIASELLSLSEGQRDKYFSRIDGSYKAVKSVRNTIVFTVHNFLKDPPFRNVDLISCRNVFIYLEPFFQKKALSTFHYALKENGFLLMGKSEGLGRSTELFEPFSNNLKLYARKAGKGRFAPTLTVSQQPMIEIPGKNKQDSSVTIMDFKKSAERVLIAEYTPANVIVNAHFEIVHINGNIESFVVPTSGKPTHELIKTARKELAFELRNALYKARESRDKVSKQGIAVKTELESFTVDVEIVPLTDVMEPHYLVVFHKKSANRNFFTKIWTKLEPALTSTQESQVQQLNNNLKREMEQLREDMRGISEEQEAYNEELQSANEELLSGNEEMQSLNEELETSKEELESTNEELIVVNRELIDKQEDLNDALTYSDDVIATVREPFLILDGDLRIQKANTSYYNMFDKGNEEIEGEHFFEVHDGLWHHEGLRALLRKILADKRQLIDEELTMDKGGDGQRIFLFNGREIIRERESKKLILLEICDITSRKNVERDYLNTIDELNRSNDQLDQFVNVASHDLQEPLRKILTFAGRITDKGKDLTSTDLETYLEKIKYSSERMSALIKNLLNYARLAHHEQLFEPTDLNSVFTDILFDFELLIEQKGAEMHIDQFPSLEAIPLQINQLFYNLISNSLKFSKKSEAPVISVTSRKLSKMETRRNSSFEPDQSYYEIVVRDNGIGFDEKYKGQIFAIFQRLNPTSEYLGTGIGLALCERIVNNHHGKINAESKEGEGSAFHVFLPLAQPKKGLEKKV